MASERWGGTLRSLAANALAQREHAIPEQQVAVSAATGPVPFLARLWLRHYLRHKARKLLA